MGTVRKTQMLLIGGLLLAAVLAAVLVMQNGALERLTDSSDVELDNYAIFLQTDPHTGYSLLQVSFSVGFCGRSEKRIVLRLDPTFQVSRALVDGQDTPFQHKDSRLIIGLPAEQKPGQSSSRLVEISYSGVVPDDHPYFYARGSEMFFSHRAAWYPQLAGRPLWTKAEISVSVPQGFQVMTQGNLLGQSPAQDDRYIYRYATNLIEHRYDVFIGQFALLEDRVGPLTISLCVPPEDQELAAEHLAAFRKIVNIYQTAFGKLPFAKLAFISAKEYRFNASGAPLAIARRDSFLRMADEGYHLLAHELAHAYWGHTVMGIGEDLSFLSEAFAEYSAHMAMREMYGVDVFDNFLGRTALRYFAVEVNHNPSLSIEQVLRTKPLDDPLSDAVRYHKGAWLLVMLEDFVGSEAFRGAARAYVRRYGRPKIYPRFLDFIAVLEEITGSNLTWFINGWYREAGEPEFSVSALEWTSGDGQGTLSVAVNMNEFSSKLPVQFVVRDDEGRGHLVREWLQPGLNTISFQLDWPPSQLEIDPHMRILKSPKNIDYSGLGSQNKLVFPIEL